MPDASSAAMPVAADATLSRRRWLFGTLVVATGGALLSLLARTLSPGGFEAIDVLIMVLFTISLPWTVIGFWNAMIGFLLMRFSADPVAAILPASVQVRGNEPMTGSAAILLCIRNEVPDRAIRNLTPLLDSLVLAGVADRFRIYVLSDTSEPAIAMVEEKLFAALAAAWRDRIAITYRRRDNNAGFKAGNVREFCDRWGANHDFAVTLDADSVMTADAVLRMIRIMQADPKLGIVQGLVVGLPSASAFARIFQFGMRLGMRSFTLGSAWWQGDCGPYWGHNAVIRLAPFIAHCKLPVLPDTGLLGGHVMSHDQIEAVLMRRAGWHVRALPEENLGWEENPPNLFEFIRRDLRWCQGNMQYCRLIGLPGLKAVSRFQIAFAILMYVGSPIWIAFLAIGTFSIAFPGMLALTFDSSAGIWLFAIIIAMMFAPKIASVADVLLSAPARARYGGSFRFLASVTAETAFSILLSPIMALIHTFFVARLLSGKKIAWSSQARDSAAVPLVEAARGFWVQTVVGCGILAIVATQNPSQLFYALMATLGLAAAIPFVVVTASPAVGAWLARIGLCRIPEETEPPRALLALDLPAIATATSDLLMARAPCSADLTSLHQARQSLLRDVESEAVLES